MNELSTTDKLLTDILNVLSKDISYRDDIEVTVGISSTMPYTINYMNRRKLFFTSPVALTLKVEDIGNVIIPANTWVDISFPEFYRLFAIGQNTLTYAVVRATDKPLITSVVPVSGTFWQTVQPVEGFNLEVPFTTTTAQRIAITDAMNYRWVSVQITSQGTGSSVAFQTSNDGINWTTMSLIGSGATTTIPVTTPSTIGLWHGPLSGRYFALNVTGISAGTTAGIIEFQTEPAALVGIGASVAQSGIWTVSPPNNITAIPAGAYTTTQIQADQSGGGGRGIRVTLNVTNAGTGSITLEIDAKDPTSGIYTSLLTGSAITANGTTIYEVYPGLTPVANSVVNDVLPLNWRIKVTANNANSITYSVGAQVLS